MRDTKSNNRRTGRALGVGRPIVDNGGPEGIESVFSVSTDVDPVTEGLYAAGTDGADDTTGGGGANETIGGGVGDETSEEGVALERGTDTLSELLERVGICTF